MNTDVRKIVLFLGAKNVPAKASPNKNSNTTLDFSYWEFPNNILPRTASFGKFPFDTDWNWLMVAVQHFNKVESENQESGLYQYKSDLNHLVTYQFDKVQIMNKLIQSIDFYNKKNKCK